MISIHHSFGTCLYWQRFDVNKGDKRTMLHIILVCLWLWRYVVFVIHSHVLWFGRNVWLEYICPVTFNVLPEWMDDGFTREILFNAVSLHSESGLWMLPVTWFYPDGVPWRYCGVLGEVVKGEEVEFQVHPGGRGDRKVLCVGDVVHPQAQPRHKVLWLHKHITLKQITYNYNGWFVPFR